MPCSSCRNLQMTSTVLLYHYLPYSLEKNYRYAVVHPCPVTVPVELRESRRHAPSVLGERTELLARTEILYKASSLITSKLRKTCGLDGSALARGTVSVDDLACTVTCGSCRMDPVIEPYHGCCHIGSSLFEIDLFHINRLYTIIGSMRLDRALSNSGYGTRSDVRTLIKKRKVTVNGEVVTDPSMHISDTDSIGIEGEDRRLKDKLYFIFDKPDEVLTAMEDKRYKNVGDFIPPEIRNLKLSPVGRLDYHTTGLLIITNDGDLSHRITSPKYEIPKVYRVTYEGKTLTEEEIREAEEGVTLTDMDKPVKLRPCKIDKVSEDTVNITLYEGKTHEVRRLISHFGRQVISLRRISIADIRLPEDSVPGTLYEMTEEQIEGLKKITGL